jgi:hypothetical protein
VRLAFSIVLIACATSMAQLPSEGRTSYSREDRIRIPFALSNSGAATNVRLYYTFDGGAWQEYESARPGSKKEFIFKADREGTYTFSTMTSFADGTSDPATKDRLYEQRRVVIDRTPPRVNSIRAVVSAEGAPGIEWDITDENMDTRSGIQLEFRWPEMRSFEPIDKGVPFAPRDHRNWEMKTGNRMQVRVVAKDKAGNRVESDAIWVSQRDGERGFDTARDGSPSRTPYADTTNASRDLNSMPSTASTGVRTRQPSVFYINQREITINYNATVGASGLTHAYLYGCDDKLDWKVLKDEGAKSAPATPTADKTRPIPLSFSNKPEADGTYNFIIVVENHRGRNRPIPKKGDIGDIQIVVDTKLPDIEIQSTKVSPNGERGAVVDIRWRATDVNIAPVPIMLEYRAANDPSGWKSISSDWIDNNGQFTWNAPTGEHHEFHIRVKCKDRAGNIGMKETQVPINVDLAVPGVEYGEVTPGGGGGMNRGPAPGAGPGSGPGGSGFSIPGALPK